MNIPVVDLNSAPTRPVTGQIILNMTTKQLEMYTGTTWQTLAAAVPDPQTWREWLDYYTNQIIDHGGIDHKLIYIQNKMQEHFPGPYVVKHIMGGHFDLEFDIPADATWWHLKYD